MIAAKVTEARQPLAARGVQQAVRPIAPVPVRTKAVPIYASLDHSTPMLSDDDVSEMDVDSKRLDGAMIPVIDSRIDEESSFGDASEEEEEEEEEDEDDWLRLSDEEMVRAEDELALIRSTFKDDVDMFDTTMVAEYADEIFKHMEDLEISVLPNPKYMDFQTEIEW